MTSYEEKLNKIHFDAESLSRRQDITYDQALKIIEIQTLKNIQYNTG